MKILALSDSLSSWHSFWIRFGQYIPDLPWDISITNNIKHVEELARGDWLLIYRYDPSWLNLIPIINQLIKIGVKIISDVDDFIWEAPMGWDRHRLQGLTSMLKMCNVITCSTEELYDILNIMFPSRQIVLIRNSTPYKNRKDNNVNKDKITICWTGAPWTRPADLAILRPLANWIDNQNIPVEWKHIGHMDGYLSFSEAVGIAPEKVNKVRLCGHQEYLKHLSGDIGLAPMSTNTFNIFKSEVKLLEYSSAYMPWIASKSSAYKSCCERWGYKGRLCSSPDDWIMHLKELLEPKKRKLEGHTLYTLANKEQSHSLIANEWQELLSRSNIR